MTSETLQATDAVETELTDHELTDHELTDEELEALALSVSVPDELDADAIPDPALRRDSGLPAAYLPAAMPGPRGRWFRIVAIVLVLMFLAITALGFCATYGQLSFA